MAALKWKAWLPIEGCLKSEGSEMTWFISPTPKGEQWQLSRIRHQDQIVRSVDIGQFSTMEEAKDNAQKLEDT